MLYYEAHVVIQPKVATAFNQPGYIADKYGFWMSVIDKEDSHEEQAGDLIATIRSSDYVTIQASVRRLVEALSAYHKVKHCKIESTVVDSNVKDEMGLLK